MKKLVPTQKEIEKSISLHKDLHPNFDVEGKRKEALAEGYKDEKCPKCKVVFLAYHHFVLCGDKNCPMKDAKDKRSLAEMILDDASGNKTHRRKKD